MCVGRCKRLFIVRTLVVDREVLFLPSSLRTIVPSQRSEGEWPREGSETEGSSQWALRRASEGKAVVDLPGEKLNLSAPSLRSAVVKLSAEVALSVFREERAERKAGKGLHEVCLPSAG